MSALTPKITEAPATLRWPLERVLFLMAGVFVLASVALAILVSPWFLLLTAFVGLNQLVYVASGTCGAALILTHVFHVQKGCAR